MASSTLTAGVSVDLAVATVGRAAAQFDVSLAFEAIQDGDDAARSHAELFAHRFLPHAGVVAHEAQQTRFGWGDPPAFQYGASSWRNADIAALADAIRDFKEPVVDLVTLFGTPPVRTCRDRMAYTLSLRPTGDRARTRRWTDRMRGDSDVMAHHRRTRTLVFKMES